MVEARAASSLAQDAYVRIRAEVVSGQVRPGARLKINDLGESLEMNVSAVREALSRLCAEGLVIALPQRGFRVASVSVSELRDLTRTRVEIEQLCIRKAVTNPDVSWETALVAAGHQLLRAKRGSPNEAPEQSWKTLHAEFHRALVAGCGSPSLMRLRDHLSVQAERYLALSVLAKGSRRNVDAEHKGLMAAVLARDAKLACERISSHYERTTELIIASGLADET
jgi:DNA-binding GntR family transcriptional regulator